MLDLLNDYRSTEAHRAWIVHDLRGHYPNPQDVGVGGLDEVSRKCVTHVSHHLDQLGLLVKRGLADEKAIVGYIGGSVLRMWGILGPYILAEEMIRAERSAREPEPYQRYFQDLAARVVDRGVKNAQGTLCEIDPKNADVTKWVPPQTKDPLALSPPPAPNG